MTKDEAIEAMWNGEKVTHRLFTEDEYIYIEDGDIYDENGYKMSFGNINFWTDRQGKEWQEGWKIYE